MADTEQFIFGVDLDGVCGDYTSSFREVAADYLGVPIESLPLERSWDFHEWGFVEGDYERIHRVAVLERRILRHLPVIDGAAEALWRLSDAGIWIRIITHRLVTNWGHALIVSDTVEWLDANRIPYRDLCFLGRKPEVQATAYIEDAPHNVEALRAGGNDVIVFDQPYNRHLEGLRASDWVQAEAVISDLVAESVGSYDAQMPGMDAGADRLDRRIVHGD